MPVTAADRRKGGRAGFPIWLFPVAPFALFVAVYFVNQSNEAFQVNSDQLSATAQNAIRTEIEAAAADAERARAEQRFQSGVCIRVDQLAPGQVYGTVNPGSILCAPDGTTAAVGRDGTVTDIARTGNTAIIRQFMGW